MSSVNSDVFKTPTAREEIGGMPGMTPDNPTNVSEVNYSEYNCKIFRGNIGDESDLDDLIMAESILTRGLNGNGEVIIIDRSTQAFESNYWIVITYLEKSPTQKL